MTKSNDIDALSTNPSKATSTPPPPSNELVNIFKNLYKKISSTISNEPKKEPSQKNNTSELKPSNSTPSSAQEKTFTFDQNELRQLFPELGTDIIEQIEILLITISPAVQKATETPNTQHVFYIQQFNNIKLVVQITDTNGKKNLMIKSTNELTNLLIKYLPQLKQHFKSKSLQFDDYNFEEFSNSDD